MRQLLHVSAAVALLAACSFPRPADRSDDDAALDDAAAEDAPTDAPVDAGIDAPPMVMLTADRTDYNFGPTVLSTDSASAGFRITNTGQLASGTFDPALLGGIAPSQFRILDDGCSG